MYVRTYAMYVYVCMDVCMYVCNVCVCMQVCPLARTYARTLKSSNVTRCGLDRGSNPGVDEIFHAVQTGFEAHPAAIPWVPDLSRG